MHILIEPMLLLFKCELYSFLLQINNQKEQITKLQSKLDNLTNAVADMKARMDPLNKEVMERHVIGLCIEVVLILLLFILFAKKNNNQVTFNSPGRSVHFMNGHGPPRLAIEDSKRSKATVLTEGEYYVRTLGIFIWHFISLISTSTFSSHTSLHFA